MCQTLVMVLRCVSPAQSLDSLVSSSLVLAFPAFISRSCFGSAMRWAYQRKTREHQPRPCARDSQDSRSTFLLQASNGPRSPHCKTCRFKNLPCPLLSGQALQHQRTSTASSVAQKTTHVGSCTNDAAFALKFVAKLTYLLEMCQP